MPTDVQNAKYNAALAKMNELHISVDEDNPRTPNAVRYLGKSSTAMFVVKAIESRNLCYSLQDMVPPEFGRGFRPHLFKPDDIEWNIGRESYWGNAIAFPPVDIMIRLVDSYFKEVNVYFPILHRGTFDRLLHSENLHLTDDGFASTVLGVCAIGARRMEYSLGDEDQEFRGWLWFNQVRDFRVGYLELPTLYDLQSRAVSRTVVNLGLVILTAVNEQLCAIFLAISSHPHSCWNVLGEGIRLAEDIGAHRKRKDMPSLHDAQYESYKRVMWFVNVPTCDVYSF